MMLSSKTYSTLQHKTTLVPMVMTTAGKNTKNILFKTHLKHIKPMDMTFQKRFLQINTLWSQICIFIIHKLAFCPHKLVYCDHQLAFRGQNLVFYGRKQVLCGHKLYFVSIN